MTFALVRKNPSREMQIAGTEAASARLMKVRDLPAIAFRAMLSASTPPDDAELDDLCRAMWPQAWYWQEPVQWGGNWTPDYCALCRQSDHRKMRAFLAALGDKP